jgi:hypothetical protein
MMILYTKNDVVVQRTQHVLKEISNIRIQEQVISGKKRNASVLGNGIYGIQVGFVVMKRKKFGIEINDQSGYKIQDQ